MPQKNTRILLAIIGVFALLAIFALRQKLTSELNESDDSIVSTIEGDESGSMHGGSLGGRARITHINEMAFATPALTRIKRIPQKEREENYDAQKLRAFGDSSIFGHVYGDKGPLEGAHIELYENNAMTKNPPLREAVTDKEGSFTLEQLNDGDVRFIFVARAEGYAPEGRRVSISGQPLEMDLRLQKGVELAGTVRDAETSAPIANATVYQPSQSDYIMGVLGTVETGPNGQFTFAAAPPGQVKTMAEKEGYHKTIRPLRAPAKEAVIPMSAGGATIRGITVNRLNDKGTSGARVIARTDSFSMSTMSKDDGSFEFKDMPGGKYMMIAIRGMASEPVRFDLGDREVKEDVKLVLPSDLFVSGRVANAGTGESLPGVKIHYSSPAGKKWVLSDERGLFAFETMVLDHYTMEVHEKNFLPLLDKPSTGSVETITRRVSPTASSDKVLIRLRRVPAVIGNVKMQRKTGQQPVPVFGADVHVTYKQSEAMEEKITQTDPKGDFFINLPEKRSGQAKVIVQKRGMIDVASARVPTRSPIQLVLRPTAAFGELLLSDRSELSGVRITSTYQFPDGKKSEDTVHLPGADLYTNNHGRFYMPLPENQRVELVFHLPDGQHVGKVYDTDQLIRRPRVFIYDPVSRDILSDAKDTIGSGNKANAQSGQQKPPKITPTAAPKSGK